MSSFGTGCDHDRYASISQDWYNVITQSQPDYLSNGSSSDVRNVIKRPLKIFCTKDSYKGEWDALGMAGNGVYTFPHGVVYSGQFRDGMFHGHGTLTYPIGHQVIGSWAKGKLIAFKFVFADGLRYEDPWDYCQMPDRRFYVSRKKGLQAADREHLTHNQPTSTIPENCYDVNDGFYNPKTKCVTNPENPRQIIRKVATYQQDIEDKETRQGARNSFLKIPTKSEETWIKANCRKAWNEPAGYRPDLYESWLSGRESELNEFYANSERAAGVEIEKEEEEQQEDLSASQHSASSSIDLIYIMEPKLDVKF